MEFKVEKEEVVQRYERVDRFIVVSEDELKQIFDVNKQGDFPIFVGAYEDFRNAVDQGEVFVIIGYHGFNSKFVLKLEEAKGEKTEVKA